MKRSQRVKAALIATAIGLSCGGTALAEGFYFGLAAGQSRFDLGSEADAVATLPSIADLMLPASVSVLQVNAVDVDENGSAWGAFVGYRWGKYVAGEIGYINFGEGVSEVEMTIDDGFDVFPVPATTDLRQKVSGPTISVLGMLPITERFDIHGRVGLLHADSRFRVRTVVPGAFADSVEIDGSSNDVLLGVGAAWNINETYAVRLEYQRFLDVGDEEDTGEEDVNLLTINLLFR